MSNGIYGYYDTKNQYVIYIGQDAHIDKEKRHKDHLSPSNYDGQHINRVLQNNPDRYVYFKFVEGNYIQDEIDDFEKEAIKLFKTYKYDYPERNVFNFTPGGDFIPSKVPEIAKKISEKIFGKKRPDFSKKISGENNPMYRKKHSAETRKKISEAKKGKKPSQETCEKISKVHNTSGYFRVSKQKNKTYKQGFCWRYIYTGDDGKRKTIQALTLNKLEIKVTNKGLLWKKINNSD